MHVTQRKFETAESKKYLPGAWVIGMLAIILALANTGWGATTDATWNSSSGNWSNAANWNPSIAPNNGGGELFDLTIPSGTVSLDMNPTIQQLSLDGGSVTGTGSLTINDAFNWSAGRIGSVSGGAVTINANGGMSISPSVGIYAGTTINNSAIANWTTGAFYATGNNVAGQNTTFNNLAGATLNVEYAGCYYAMGSLATAPDVFNNAGVFNKSSGGNAIIYAEFNNSNAVNVEPGTLSLYGGGTQTGSFYVDSGGMLELGQAPNSFKNGSSVGGNGDVYFSSSQATLDAGSIYNPTGTTQITSSTVNFNSAGVSISGPLIIQNGIANFNTGGNQIAPSSISLVSGRLAGSDAITTAGLFTWTGGTLGAIGSSQILSANGMGIDGNVTFAGGTINNTGIATWSGGAINATGQNAVGQNTVFNNPAGAVFNAQCDATYSGNGSQSEAPDVFNNAGTFSKVVSAGPPGTTEIDAEMNNSGVINVQYGTLDLAGGGKQTGEIVVSSGATVQFNRGSFNFGSGSHVGGAGSVEFAGGASTFESGSMLNPTGTITVHGGTLIANHGTAISSGGFIQTGGVTRIDGTLTTPSVDISGGSFQASGAIAGLTSFKNDGVVSPGDAPGTLAIDGLYTQDAEGQLNIGLGGFGTGQYDVLAISGAADLNGTLDVSLVNGFTPIMGEQFTILTTTTGINGTFSNVIVPYGCIVSYSANSIVLEAPGSVPEPASLALLGLAAFGLMMRRSPKVIRIK